MTQIGQEPPVDHKSVHGLWKPSEATRSAPIKNYPPVQGKTSLPSMHSIFKDQEWCIYSIMYHYETFLLRNPMVTLSGPNYVIPNQVPNPSPISKEDFSDIWSGDSLAATRRPFKDPNPLALQELGCQFSPGLFQGQFSELINHIQSFSRHQVLRIPWKAQLVHTGSNQVSCMALAQLGQFIFHCGESVTQFSSQDGQDCIGPIQKIQPDDSPSRISLSAFHIYWPPFITWELFSQLINILDFFYPHFMLRY
ncbi:hypothetical protein O181_001275 [Austropuccinia psidii MF-1]|uniref:Uncharacterized protein n=1 Tax=Austropuccinia psidii MF-1 TaxID=1389203 RepID=A0A9Q3GBN7_9BASI|nr:hypothetical protein [Austropuccinia psidii MF-1]